MERELYRKVCHEAETNFKVLDAEIDLDEVHDACSLDTTIHHSFDFAQQIHIPSNPMQPGPIYFKTPRKCGIFGVMCEAVPRQVNYLIDEASDIGKGANTTISYVHHYYFPLPRTWRKTSAPSCRQLLRAKQKQLLPLVLSMENNHALARIDQVLLSHCWSHKVWPRS